MAFFVELSLHNENIENIKKKEKKRDFYRRISRKENVVGKI